MNAEEILEQIRALPDGDCFPLPAYYHDKNKIPYPAIITPKEFYDSEYTLKCALAKKDFPTIVIDKPIKDGFVYPIAPAENVKIDLQSIPYTDNMPPKVLKGLVLADPNTPLDCITEEEQKSIIQELTKNSEIEPATQINLPEKSVSHSSV